MNLCLKYKFWGAVLLELLNYIKIIIYFNHKLAVSLQGDV